MKNIKKTTILVGVLIISVSVLCLNGLGRPAEPLVAKEVVSKILTAHSFTPPIVLEGANGLVWYVGCRSLTSLSAEQAIVGVRAGNASSVEVAPFRRDKLGEPWTAVTNKANVAALATLERNMKAQLEKDLAAAEKSAKP